MTSFSGLSAVLTISLVAMVTLQLMKDKIENIENYGEDGQSNESFTFRPADTAMNVGEARVNVPTLNQDMSDEKSHGATPFGTGDFFRQPYVAPNATANGYNATPDAYKVYMANVNAATPTQQQLMTIGSETTALPGPGVFNNDQYAMANVNTGRAANLSLCSQNMSTFSSGVGNPAVSSSLLPGPHIGNKNEKMEGFGDCDVTNVLANQVFLSRESGGIIGTNTVSGSLRNGNQSIRSDPPNPTLYVGPWNTSSIYPDLLRRPLEGCGPSFGLYGNGPNGSGVPTNIKNL
jgi:hypothetical protein